MPFCVADRDCVLSEFLRSTKLANSHLGPVHIVVYNYKLTSDAYISYTLGIRMHAKCYSSRYTQQAHIAVNQSLDVMMTPQSATHTGVSYRVCTRY